MLKHCYYYCCWYILLDVNVQAYTHIIWAEHKAPWTLIGRTSECLWIRRKVLSELKKLCWLIMSAKMRINLLKDGKWWLM